MNITPVTAGVGILGAAAGFAVSHRMTEKAYLHDMLADPNQVIRNDGGVVIERPRPQIGPLTMLGNMVGGALLAGAGGALFGGGAARQAAAAGAFAIGGGLVMGGVATATLYQNARMRRE